MICFICFYSLNILNLFITIYNNKERNKGDKLLFQMIPFKFSTSMGKPLRTLSSFIVFVWPA